MQRMEPVGDGTPPALPIFYTREHDAYKGTRVALWEAFVPDTQPDHLMQCKGTVGAIGVHLWAQRGPRGIYFVIKRKQDNAWMPLGTANAYVAQGFNQLAISLKFSSQADVAHAKEVWGIKEMPKPWKDVFFINVYANVSLKAVQQRPQTFSNLGFLTGPQAVRAKRVTDR